MGAVTVAINQLVSWLSGAVHDPVILVMFALVLVVWMAHFVIQREIKRTVQPAGLGNDASSNSQNSKGRA